MISPDSIAIYALRAAALVCGALFSAHAQTSAPPDALNHGRPVVDAHNCYPYDGQWSDRIDRALLTGRPVSIEQDLAWHVDPATHKGTVVVAHSAKTTGQEPTLRRYFFDRVRPIVEDALRKQDKASWPLIILHFDFKDNQEPLLRAVWKLLGEYPAWITAAPRLADAHALAPFDMKPLLVITEDSDAQQKVFFDEVPVGARLLLFGSAHTHQPPTNDREAAEHWLATTPPEELLTETPTNYRRWWNNSWHEVEEGGQQHAGDWTAADAARLKALVDFAHQRGFWIRFYTLDGFDPAEKQGWFQSYNFGSLAAAQQRWKAAADAGVNFIASDQYEALAAFLRANTAH